MRKIELKSRHKVNFKKNSKRKKIGNIYDKYKIN